MMRLSLSKVGLTLILNLLFFIPGGILFAQVTSQVMSVTPPLFQISALPGDVWQSTIKVVNGNAYPMTVYAELVNFNAEGEQGQGKFVPVLNTPEKISLAEWITVPEGPHTILPEQTKDIPFVVEFPKDAAPGGHYAAILITTRPPTGEGGELSVKTAQAVTSLIFARIEGDVKEMGSIREFRTQKSFVQTPKADFLLRFENKGNVHLQPRGDILITNMWGTERGRIPINYQSHFGNVLPESIREFKFVWESELSFTDVGRYKAEVTLGYGENGVKSVSGTTYFWVVPVKITLITLLTLACFIFAIVFMVRLYVRKMLLLAGVEVDREEDMPTPLRHQGVRYPKVSAPIRAGVLDLRKKLDTAEESVDIMRTIINFIIDYKVFFVSVTLLILMVIFGALYIGHATNPDDDYQIIIDEGDAETTMSKDEVESVTGAGE